MGGRVWVAGLAALTLSAATAQAQRGRRGGGGGADEGPSYSVGVNGGLLEGTEVFDGPTGSVWDFGYSSELGATLDKRLNRQITIGLAANFATAPLNYTSNIGFQCPGSCAAKADIAQYLATVRVVNERIGYFAGPEGEAGVTQYSNFRESDTNEQLPPTNGAYDFTFGLGFRAGYAFSPMNTIFVRGMGNVILHNEGNASSPAPPRQFSFSAGCTVGF